MSTRPASRPASLLPGITRVSLLVLVAAVGHLQSAAVGSEQDPAQFFPIQRARSHTTGNRNLVPGLVDITVTALAARDRDHFAATGVACNQFRFRIRGKP